MSKREYLHRYLLIIRKLEKGEATFEELNDYLKAKSELQGDNLEISQRTFIRDRQEILSLFSINIEYDFKRKVYFIANDDHTDLGLRTLEAFETFNALKMSEDLSQYISVQKGQAQGMEHFQELLKGIKTKKTVHVNYQKFGETEATFYVLEPYALKEFDGRWYLIAYNFLSGEKWMTLALDRIKYAIVKPDYSFMDPHPDWNVKEYFKDCFGIFRPHDSKPEKIVLSFTSEQGKYIKSLPLHDSQKIMVDNEEELRIQLYLFPTYDFIRELLSHGDDVEVISPAKLRKDLSRRYASALEQYQ